MWVCSGEIWSRYYFSKKKSICVCVCVSSFPIKRNNKKESEKRKKEDLRNIKWMGVIFLYLCDGFTEYIHFKFSNGVN